MVDFVKIRIRGPRHRHYRRALRDHPDLQWETPNLHLHYPPHGCSAVAEWSNGWVFFANDEEVMEIRGSLHKLYHGTNWSDFTLAQCRRAVEQFCDHFGVFSGALALLNVELGVNVLPPIPTEDLLPRVLFHRTSRPVLMPAPAKGIIIHRKGHYRLKLYDKSGQYGLSYDLLRFEIHVDRMAILKKQGIRNVDDLLKEEVWIRAQSFLLQKFEELFLVDSTIAPGLVSTQQAGMLAQAEDWGYWKDLSPKARCIRRNKLDRLYATHSQPFLRGALRQQLHEKFAVLRDGS
jgi:hypothetical protein